VLFSLQPIPRLKRGWQMAISFGVLLGIPALAIVASYLEKLARPNWYMYLIAIALLFFVAAYRLQGRIDELTTPVLEIKRLTLQANDPQAIPGYRLYYFYVVNPTATFVERIEVQLEKIEPAIPNLSWLPIHLHLKHDNPPPHTQYRTSFDLAPHGEQMADLVDSASGWAYIRIVHAVMGINAAIPKQEFVLTVRAQAKNIGTPSRARFRVFIKPHAEVECELLENATE
jgi:hypothetical protein